MKRRGELPLQPTTFVGREHELAEAKRLLLETCLLTLTGSGGCGKTRLALQVALQAEMPDGVWWVDLVGVSDPGLVPAVVAAALSVRETPAEPIDQTLIRTLQLRNLLLVVDNCEHVLSGCAALATSVLRCCPGVTLLATSRQPLGIDGEIAFRVPSMRLPPEDAMEEDGAGQYEAVALFCERAAEARRTFALDGRTAPAVVRICRRLDGIPLALELAAAWLRVLDPGQLASRLGDRFRLLGPGTPGLSPRQRTLEASIDWSYSLLEEPERNLLVRLAVFSGGFTLEAAERVCAGWGLSEADILPALSGLVDKSLVHVEESAGSTRFRLLETIRAFALTKLESSGNEDLVRARHLEHMLEFVESMESELDHAHGFELIDAELANIRAALDRSVASDRIDEGLRLVSGLYHYWVIRGHWREARARCDALLSRGGAARSRAAGFALAARTAMMVGDWSDAEILADEARRCAAASGHGRIEAWANDLLGWTLMWTGRWPAAREAYERSLETGRRAGYEHAVAWAMHGIGMGESLYGGDLVEGRRWLDDAVELWLSISDVLAGPALVHLGSICLMLGAIDDARVHLQRAVPPLEAAADVSFCALAQGLLAVGDAQRGRLDEAEAAARNGTAQAEASASPLTFPIVQLAVGLIARARDERACVDAFRSAVVHWTAIGAPGVLPWLQGFLALAAAEWADRDALRDVVDRATAVASTLPTPLARGAVADANARLAELEERFDEAEDHAYEALDRFGEAHAVPRVIEALELVASLAAASESGRVRVRLLAAAHTAAEREGYVRFPGEVRRTEAACASARSRLSDDEYAAAWAEGTAMSLEEAVAYARRGRGERKRPAAGWGSLTPMEVEVVRCVVEGLTNAQIAERLFITNNTVKTHLQHVYGKLGVSTRAGLAVAASRRGL